MIEELTREQIDARPAYSRKWSRIAFSSGNTDRRRSESAIRALYEIAGLERPDILIWLRSPLEACLAIHILSDHVDSAYHAISNGVFAKLRAQVWDHISLDARVQAWIPADDESVESDGSRKKYYLRVPPAMKDAREALAWTFSLSRDKYHPLWES